MNATKPKLGVFKFASCDGCQLSLLDAEDHLLGLAEAVEIAYFLEATSRTSPGPYDIALVEGSITTPHDIKRIKEVRRQSRYLITIGACATAGGIQALRNWADCDDYLKAVYASPEYISTLATSTAIAEHVRVDFELRGCPINQHQLIEVVQALLAGRQPRTPQYSVCLECKRRGTVCVMIAQNQPCLGPVTQAGCGAICPAYNRACYGCFGPVAPSGVVDASQGSTHSTPPSQTNLMSLTDEFNRRGVAKTEQIRLLRSFNADSPLFREESNRLESVGGDAAPPHAPSEEESK